MKDTGKVLATFIAGAAAGTVAGLLMAPEKGKDTREKIKKETDRYLGDFDQQFKKGMERVNELKDSLSTAIKKVEKEAENLSKQNSR